jgi:hypothetical protein
MEEVNVANAFPCHARDAGEDYLCTYLFFFEQ